jgi:hypothetical protein
VGCGAGKTGFESMAAATARAQEKGGGDGRCDPAGQAMLTHAPTIHQPAQDGAGGKPWLEIWFGRSCVSMPLHHNSPAARLPAEAHHIREAKHLVAVGREPRLGDRVTARHDTAAELRIIVQVSGGIVFGADYHYSLLLLIVLPGRT